MKAPLKLKGKFVRDRVLSSVRQHGMTKQRNSNLVTNTNKKVQAHTMEKNKIENNDMR